MDKFQLRRLAGLLTQDQIAEHHLMEGRDAPLFHGTRDYAVFDILRQNRLDGMNAYSSDSINDSGQSSIRFSRSYQMAKKFALSEHDWIPPMGVVFQLDQRKLSQRYKIIPFADQDNGATRDLGASEYEEVVLADEISPLTQYLTRIFVDEESTNLALNNDEYAEMVAYDLTDGDVPGAREMVSKLINHPLAVPLRGSHR